MGDEDEKGKWVYYGEVKTTKPEKPKTERIEYPKEKKGILAKLGQRRREAKATRAERKEHKKEVGRAYWEALKKEELKAASTRAHRDVAERMLKKRGKAETLKKVGKGLAELDRKLAGKPKKKPRKTAGSSSIIVIQGDKVRKIKPEDLTEEEEYEEYDPSEILFGKPDKRRKTRKQHDPWNDLFG